MDHRKSYAIIRKSLGSILIRAAYLPVLLLHQFVGRLFITKPILISLHYSVVSTIYWTMIREEVRRMFDVSRHEICCQLSLLGMQLKFVLKLQCFGENTSTNRTQFITIPTVWTASPICLRTSNQNRIVRFLRSWGIGSSRQLMPSWSLIGVVGSLRTWIATD